MTAQADPRIDEWLAAFENASNRGDVAGLRTLFTSDGHWRDLLALGPDFRTVPVADLEARLGSGLRKHGLSDVRRSHTRLGARWVQRAGRRCCEVIFEFSTNIGRGEGVVRLVEDNAELKAWNLLTALQVLDGHEEKTGPNRPTGTNDSRQFGGRHWAERRSASQRYVGRDPEVLIVGGGQSGLALAARLGQLDVDCLIVDRHERVGDNWRKRYEALTLHNQIGILHLPYMPFPDTWPGYVPKDRVANWFESYVDAMEINFWTSTTLKNARYDAEAGVWDAELVQANGSTRTMRPPHLVLAIGIFGAPKIPTLPGLADFTGEVIHAADYRDGARWAGRKVVVLGTGNSGHDVAQDLHAWGAEVTLVQRGSTTVLSVVPSQADSEAIFDEGPAEDIDLLVAATPLPDLEQASRLSAEHSQENDADLLAGLSRIGFRLDFGADGTGSSMKYLRSGGGYYLNVGCSELLVEGEIALAHWEDVATFVDDGLHMKDGAGIPADLVVLATGYEPLSEYLCTTLGPETSAKVGAIWGFGQDAELRNVWRPTAQDGLWIMAGNFQQCRFFSRLLALQLKARLDGVRL